MPIDSADATQAEAVLRTAVDQVRQAVWSKPNANRIVVAQRDCEWINALLMIVAKHNGRGGRRLRVEGASSHVRRLFRCSCAEFLLS